MNLLYKCPDEGGEMWQASQTLFVWFVGLLLLCLFTVTHNLFFAVQKGTPIPETRIWAFILCWLSYGSIIRMGILCDVGRLPRLFFAENSVKADKSPNMLSFLSSFNGIGSYVIYTHCSAYLSFLAQTTPPPIPPSTPQSPPLPSATPSTPPPSPAPGKHSQVKTFRSRRLTGLSNVGSEARCVVTNLLHRNQEYKKKVVRYKFVRIYEDLDLPPFNHNSGLSTSILQLTYFSCFGVPCQLGKSSFLVRNIIWQFVTCHCQAAPVAGKRIGVPASNSTRLPKRAGTMHAPLAWRWRLTWSASETTTSRYSSYLRPENTAGASTFGLDSTTSESKGHSSGVTGHPQRTPPGIEENQTTGAAMKIVLRLLQRGSGGMTTIADTQFTSFASEDKVKRCSINCYVHQFVFYFLDDLHWRPKETPPPDVRRHIWSHDAPWASWLTKYSIVKQKQKVYLNTFYYRTNN